jgi:hypothetical protein
LTELPVEQDLLLPHHVPRLEQWSDSQSQLRCICKQGLDLRGEAVAVDYAELQPVHLQQSTDRGLDRKHVLDELLARDLCCPQ